MAKGGQIVDATIIQAPKQHNNRTRRRRSRLAKSRRSGKTTRAEGPRHALDGEVFKGQAGHGNATSAATKQHDIAIPILGYKNHAGIDRAHGFIRGWTVTSASAHDGAQLRNVVAKDNRPSTVWADSAYRSKTKEEWLQDNGLKSDIHQRKPKGKPMPEAMSRANGRRSKVRSAVEHVFARQKDKMKHFIRTIGEGEDRHGQYRLQYASLCLADRKTAGGMTQGWPKGRNARRQGENHYQR
ncbi:transposase [Rhizobium johnstonii]|uniref:transposase n=1 Tax=Rhizobium johnstonii TaxID=3019933 RepID=UPI003F96B8A2